jgi:hypothetical protein
MEITGATFNLNKTVTSAEKESTPNKPTDNSKLQKGIAGEKTGKQNIKDFINLTIVQQTLKATVNNTIQNIQGSQLSEQAGALQSVASMAVSSVFMAKNNTYALVASMAAQGISLSFKMAKYSRQTAWESYNIDEYNSARGYSAGVNRTRNL